uniref:Uncharacterized protein n=1 Tax=Zea mays TaxID=4577 RepID=C4IZK8_MAIZE|nr:unknown [Zea mays]
MLSLPPPCWSSAPSAAPMPMTPTSSSLPLPSATMDSSSCSRAILERTAFPSPPAFYSGRFEDRGWPEGERRAVNAGCVSRGKANGMPRNLLLYRLQALFTYEEGEGPSVVAAPRGWQAASRSCTADLRLGTSLLLPRGPASSSLPARSVLPL